MAVTGTITTRFIDENGVDLGKILIEKDYVMQVYPNLIPGVKTPSLFVWGENGGGQLGDNTIIHRSSPVETIAAEATWKQVACGYAHTASVKADGTLWCWGNNLYRQLGDNTGINKSSPVQTVAFGSNWTSVACGHLHTAAIKLDGTLWTWGWNSNAYGADGGQLGDNTTTTRSSPVQTITGGTNWSQVSAGYANTAAIKTDGTLWMWGNNYNGLLGDNTTIGKSSPIQTITFGTNWQNVSCGSYYTAAIKTDGTLWTWGHNTAGNLGDNTTIHRSSPVQVLGSSNNWRMVSCSNGHTAAIKNDGTLWLWGGNTYGQLGDNTAITRSSPVQTVSRGTNWNSVACGRLYTAAIKTDGTLWTWGYNTYGSLGDNTTTHRSSPVQTIVLGYTWKQAAKSFGFQGAAIQDGDY